MRTQAEESNSQHLFEKIGFSVIPNVYQSVDTFVQENGQRKPVKQKRHFLLKQL
jgi:hypothetical protein